MKKFLIVDGNSILNRAFYGVRELTNSKGFPTNAIFGVVNILTKHLEHLQPDYAAIAFDLKHPTFRHEKYDAYKANRKGMPEELACQLPYAKECVKYMGFHIVEAKGYEADDIIGTLASSSDHNGDVQSYILTGDRDSLQLISDRTSVILAKTKEDILYDAVSFEADFGVHPTHYVDVKALMGDSSDNIPGVAGVGEKTAVKLIAEYGNLENLYDNLENGAAKGALLTKLQDGRDSAYLSRELAEIFRSVPIDTNLAEYAYAGFDNTGLYNLFTELEFSGFIKRFSLSGESISQNESVNITKETILRFPSDLPKDTMLSVYFDEIENTLHFSTADSNVYRTDVVEKDQIAEFLSDRSIICHNYKKLYSAFIAPHAAKEPSEIYDVMLEAYVQNSSLDGKFTLADLTRSYLSISLDMQERKEEAPHEYGNLCAVLIFQLHDAILPMIEKEGSEALLRNIELPLAKILADMELHGFKVDVEGLKEYSEYLTTAEGELSERIYMEAGETFNINSPKQLGEILFEKIKLPHGKKTKTGYSTNAETLEKLRPYHPIIADILEYRQLSKLRGTYGEGLIKMVDGKSRIHTCFNQTGTATGRLSSNDPNLQNIPVRYELGRRFRQYFIAENKDYILIDADYSQIELRLLAHISGDENMIEAFRSGKDFHSVTASQVFGVPQEFVTDELRKRAKAVNFGIVYGIGDFSLAEDLGISKKEAGAYITSYLSAYPEVDHYLKKAISDAHETGFTTTMFGRRRYIPELSAKNKNLVAFGERVAMNSPIQGTAADIIKIAMVNTAQALEDAKIDARLILQVHDELILEAHRDVAEKAAEILQREMENAAVLKVPLIAEVKMGDNWYDSK